MNHFDILGIFLHFKTKIEMLIRYFHIKSPYSSRVWKNAVQKKLRIWTLFTKCRLTLSVERKPKILLKSYLQCSHPKIYKVQLIRVKFFSSKNKWNGYRILQPDQAHWTTVSHKHHPQLSLIPYILGSQTVFSFITSDHEFGMLAFRS